MLKHKLQAFVLLIAVAVLILDAPTAVSGAEDGLQICFKTLIPSLFPMIFATTILLPNLLHFNCINQTPLHKLYRIPKGSEGLLLTGLLGGYPVGAHAVGQAVSNGTLNQPTAQRMIVFCNACGPAFIFGVGFNIFQDPRIPWITWIAHILSGYLTAQLLPNSNVSHTCFWSYSEITIQEGLQRSIRSMAQICGWVMILRVLITILQKWILWCMPPIIQTIFIGFLELSNGCLCLTSVSNEALRFILYATFISFGGICVVLQTIGSSPKNAIKLYFPGKILQCNISMLLAIFLCPIFAGFKPTLFILMIVPAIFIPICLFWLQKIQNRGGILATTVV